MGDETTTGSRWYALTVKPRHEKSASMALRNRGFEEFLPVYRSRRFWSDRIKEIELPLFAGYLFCRFSLGKRAAVLKTPSVTSIVGFGNVPTAIPDKEIGDLKRLAASGLPLQPWPFLKVGQRVRIIRGPVRGVEGIVLKTRDACRVIVSISLLQRSLAVEIDVVNLCPAEDSSRRVEVDG